MTPLGGTELQMAELKKRLSTDYFKKIKITLSIPEKDPLDRDRINVLWMKNSYDQPNIAPWFSEPENLRKYDWYVFNSHWNYEKFRYLYKLPTHKCSVIKNALPTIKWKERKTWKPGDPVKLIHTSTPWRGLNVLLGTMELIKDSNITLDVYSSTQLYGDQFKEANDKRFEPMYEKMDKMPNVNYIGYKPNLEVIDAMQESNMFVYPSIWEETSCISAIEAMACGNIALVTNYGALPETCGDYGYYVNYDTNPKRLAQEYAAHLLYIKQILPTDAIQQRLENQRQHFGHFYNWDERIKEWIAFLNNALQAKGISHEG